MSTTRPLVSIGIPVYNGERYLTETLNAALAQTYKDYELILSDNNSTDRTQEICQKYAAIEHPDWLFSYGKVLDLLGDCQEEENSFYLKAVKAFQSVLLIDPDYPKIHYHLGLSYSHLGEITFENKYFFNAINFFRIALQQNEEDDQSYLEWGLCLIYLAEQNELSLIKNQYLMLFSFCFVNFSDLFIFFFLKNKNITINLKI